jgi:hypothetical protein
MSDPEPMDEPMDQDDRQIKKASAAEIGVLQILNRPEIILLWPALIA